VLNTYPQSKVAKLLQSKFFVPNDSKYSDAVFFQNAAELSVSNHLKRSPVTGFETEKEMNATNGYDVDNYFEAGPFRVSLEVKTPDEQRATPGDWVLQTLGRSPNYQQQYQKLAPLLAPASPNRTVVPAKNKDCTAKDFLLSANTKFNPTSSVDDLKSCSLLAATSTISATGTAIYSPPKVCSLLSHSILRMSIEMWI
jgi:hypothetical protein